MPKYDYYILQKIKAKGIVQGHLVIVELMKVDLLLSRISRRDTFQKAIGYITSQ